MRSGSAAWPDAAAAPLLGANAISAPWLKRNDATRDADAPLADEDDGTDDGSREMRRRWGARRGVGVVVAVVVDVDFSAVVDVGGISVRVDFFH